LRQKNKMGLQNVSANESRNILDDFLIKWIHFNSTARMKWIYFSIYLLSLDWLYV
jgi:hypothetical protein